jgi:hypothetical protein
MFLAHAPISFLGNQLIQRKAISRLKQNERILIGIAAMIFGIIPDIDILILLGSGLPSFIHHTVMSHTPLFYIGVWLLLKLIYWIVKRWFNKTTEKVLNPEFVNALINTFLIATLLHLLADFFAEDIMLLYPFTTQNFTLFKYLFEPNMFGGYFLSITFGIEIVIVGIFFAYILNLLLQKSRIQKFVSILFIIPGVVFFGLNIYGHLNTYNRSILRDVNGKVVNDIDNDAIFDAYDMDVDNDGKDNIMDIELKDLAKQVSTVLESEKWTANKDDGSLMGRIKLEYGGMTSFRLISQAYLNIHSPISPVLRDMLMKDGTINSYSSEFDSQEAFYRYFNYKKMLVAWNQDSNVVLEKGDIFFVLDKDGKVLNMGMILENDGVGTVLPYDKNLRIHTFNDVTNYYDKNISIMITE